MVSLNVQASHFLSPYKHIPMKFLSFTLVVKTLLPLLLHKTMDPSVADQSV